MRTKPVFPVLKRRHLLGRHLKHGWVFHEGSGLTTGDVADPLTRGTLTGAGVTWATGRHGWSINQTATAAHYVAMPSLPVSRIIPDRFTVIFGYNPGASTDRPVFGFLGSGTGNAADPFESYDAGVNFGNGSSYQLLTALANATANTINVYAITDDGTNYTVYKDGVQATQNAITINPASGSNRQFCIGGSGMSGTLEDNHAGRMLFFYIFDRALTRAEIVSIGADPYQFFVPPIGDRVFSSASTTPTAPTAPSSLVATTVSSTRISLSWTDNSGDEERFYIERSTNKVTWSEINYVATDIVSYNETGLTKGTTYYYRVRAYKAGVFSTYSNTDSATTDYAPTYADDISTNMAGIYSVRKAVQAYASNLIRLRRDSDSAESDFGFDGNGDLDTSAITTWLGGANGYLVTWYDQSGNGYDMSQATAGNQPQYTATGGPNGGPGFKFDGSDDYLAANAMASALFSGASKPISISAAIRYQTAADIQAVFALSSSSTTGFHYYGSLNSDYITNVRRPDGGSSSLNSATILLHSAGTDYIWTHIYKATAFGTLVNGTTQAHPITASNTVTADRAYIGQLHVQSTFFYPFNGYVSEVLIYDDSPSISQIRDLAAYQNNEYAAFTWDLPLEADNASDHLDIPVYSGADYQAIHPDVYDSGEGLTTDGHRFWMVHTPYPGGDATKENPSIVISDAVPSVTQAWSEPGGITNPIAGPPGAGNYGDADLILGQDGVWYVYYFWNTATDEIRIISSSDGVTWSGDAQLFTVSGNGAPMVLWDGTQYVMYTVDIGASPNGLKRRTSASPDSGWSASSSIGIAAIDGRELWDSNIIYDSATGVFHGFFGFTADPANGTSTIMYYATSTDGTTWTVYKPALLNPQVSSSAWDNAWIYRSAPIKTASGFDLWYSSKGADWHTGYTEVVPIVEPLNINMSPSANYVQVVMG